MGIFMPPLSKQGLSWRTRKFLIIGLISFSVLCMCTLITLTATDVLCDNYILADARIFLITTIALTVMMPCLVSVQRKNIKKHYKQVIDGLADADERPEQRKPKRRVKKTNYLPGKIPFLI